MAPGYSLPYSPLPLTQGGVASRGGRSLGAGALASRRSAALGCPTPELLRLPPRPGRPPTGWPAPTTQSRTGTVQTWVCPRAQPHTLKPVSEDQKSPGTHAHAHACTLCTTCALPAQPNPSPGPSAALSGPLFLCPQRDRGRGCQQRGHFPSRYPVPCSSSPRPRRGGHFPAGSWRWPPLVPRQKPFMTSRVLELAAREA